MPNVSWAVEMWKTLRRLRVYHIPTATTTATTIVGNVMSITLIPSTRGLDKGAKYTLRFGRQADQSNVDGKLDKEAKYTLRFGP